MKKTMFAAAFVLGFGAIAHAADGKYQVGLGLYDSIPVSSDFKEYKSSLGFNVYGDYKINDTFAAGVELGDTFGYAYKADTSIKEKELICGVRGKIGKSMDFGSKKGNVYGIVGIASHRFSSSGYKTITKVDYNFGAGAQMEIAPQWLVGLEARYHALKATDQDTGKSLNINGIVPTLTFGYSF